MSLKERIEPSGKRNTLSPNQPEDFHQQIICMTSSKVPELEKLIRTEETTVQNNKLVPKLSYYPIESHLGIPKREDEDFNIEKSIEPCLIELKNFLLIRIRTEFERVEEFKGKHIALEFYKALLRIKYAISDLSRVIISSSLFQFLVISVIFFNTVILALEDPRAAVNPYPYNDFELFFAIFYTTEFGMIVIANGLWMNSNSYFREGWNILDFTIIVTAWLSLFAQSGFSLSSLRSLRILRPLRSISSIKGMKVLVQALFISIKPLFFSFFILFFFIYIFAIGGVQLWSGALRGICMELDTGINANPGYFCGDYVCLEGQRCVNGLDNPYFGITNFDNIFMSFITTFQIITLEGWTQVMEYTVTAFSYYSVFFYMPLVFIASDLILNFAMAIVIISFKNASDSIYQKKIMADRNETVNEAVFEKIYKNTLIQNDRRYIFNINGGDAIKVIDGYDKIEGKENEIHNYKQNFDCGGIINLCSVTDEDYNSDNKSGYYDCNQMKFKSSLAIYLNSIFSRAQSVNTQPISIKNSFSHRISTKLEQKLSTHSFFQFPTKSQRNPNIANINSEAEISEKTIQNFSKLKNVLSIKLKTLDFLQKNPSSLKNTRIELSEDYTITSDSLKEVIPVQDGSNPTFPFFTYYPIDTTDPIIAHSYSKVKNIYEAHQDFPSKNSLFRFLYLKYSVRTAFFLLKPEVCMLINQQNQKIDSNQGEWSGLDVDPAENESHLSYIKTLSNLNYKLWENGYAGAYQRSVFFLKCVMIHKYTGYLTLAAVIINTIVLSLERYGISQNEENNLQSINIFFTYFFTCEVFLKIVALGPVQFIRDAMNVLDTIVVLLSLVELFILTGGTSLSALRAIRIFRILRGLRIIKIFRYLKSMTLIVNSIAKSLSTIFYLFLLVALFLIIFTMLNIQVFRGNFNFPEGLPRTNFDSFHWALVTTFQILSTENWNDILTSSLRSQAGPSSCLLLVAWIVLGNYILLNLFLAILLDSFNVAEEDPVALNERKISSKAKKKIEDLEKHIESESEDFESIDIKIKTTQVDYMEYGKSYWLFSNASILRNLCCKLNQNPVFETLFLILILMNSVKLVWDTYILDAPSSSVEFQISNNLDIAFTACYILEFFIKSIALGFCFESNSYISDHWNKLDFAIVVISIADLALSSITVPFVKVFRVLRTLRPLKLIKHNNSMKISVYALVESFAGIVNVMIFIFIIWLMYAILGVSLLAGKMHSCTNQAINDIDTCHAYGYEWKEEMFNFDNVLQAMVELFIVMSQESWPNRMTEAVDAVAIGKGPIENYDLNMAYFYCAYLIIANFYLLNLFTVVIFDKFTDAKRNESSLSSLLLSKEQVLWSEIQSMIVRAKPWSAKIKFHSQFRKRCYELSKSKAFEIWIMVIIIINMLSMSMNYYGASDIYNKNLEFVNIACTFIFIIEAAIKILGLGLHYFKSNWNKFDFSIMLFCLIDIILSYSYIANLNFLRQGPQLVRVLRVMRILRLFRLIKPFESLIKILNIITYTMPAMINVLGLLLLVFFIYAVLGAFLFHSINSGRDVDYYFNFHNFHAAMILLWRMSTGEDYPVLMYDFSSQTGSYGYYLYFLTFVFISDFVILDLFISLVLQYFEEFYVEPYNPFTLFTEDLRILKKHWITEIKEFSYKIDREGVIKVIGNAGVEFKFLKNNDTMSAVKLIGAMNIESDSEGMFYFNDVLYALLRRKYFKKINKRQFRIDFTIMRVEEVKTKKALMGIRESYDRMSAKRRRESILRKGNNNSQVIDRNMFFEALFLKSVFISWKNYVSNVEKYNQQATPENSDVEYPGENSLDIK